MADRTFELQQALYAAVAAALSPMKVFDYVPENPALPYAVIDFLSTTPWGGKGNVGQEHEIEVACYHGGEQRGKKAAQQKLSLVIAALHDVALNIANQSEPVRGIYLGTSFDVSEDGKIVRGAATFRYFTQ